MIAHYLCRGTLLPCPYPLWVNVKLLYYRNSCLVLELIMYTLKIHKIGDSLGITLPQEVLQQLNAGEGDEVCLTETAEGVQITVCDREFEKAMKIYRKGSNQYRNALRELAQ